MAEAVDPACVELGALLRETRTKHRPDIKAVKAFAHELRAVLQRAPTRDAVSNIETGHKWPAQRVVEGYERVCHLPEGLLVREFQRLHGKRQPRRTEPHAVITSPHDRSTACHTQIVEGQWSGHLEDHVLWIVVRPVLTDRYYPQLAPIAASGDGARGTWVGAAFLGRSSAQNIGEWYELMVVLASPKASKVLAGSQGARSRFGRTSLPPGARILHSIGVRRGAC